MSFYFYLQFLKAYNSPDLLGQSPFQKHQEELHVWSRQRQHLSKLRYRACNSEDLREGNLKCQGCRGFKAGANERERLFLLRDIQTC